MVAGIFTGMQPAAPIGVWRRVVLTLEMIKFEHSVFALPFALTGALLAWRYSALSAGALAARLAWIIVAMVTARSAAMAFNRAVDASIDARNPRTRSRHIPAGLLSLAYTWAFVAAASSFFVAAAAMLNPLCLRLSPVALCIVFFYSWTKRFTAFSHLVLGFSLGIAPAAAWIAVLGSLSPAILWLTAAVTLWTAGFDVIYSCQDLEFDRSAGLHSVPARLGIPRALILARLSHLAMLGFLAVLAYDFAVGPLAWSGVAVTAALLAWEHRLVRADDLSRVDTAFFTVNGWISVLFFLFWAGDVLLARRGSY